MSEDEYAARFRDPDDVDRYENCYESGTRDRFTWELQKPVLERVLADLRRERSSIRLLDFACGTGRILSFLEDEVDEADGLDLSPEMATRAREVCHRATVHVGHLGPGGTPAAVERDYDLVTAFRFFLNVDDAVRRQALGRLHGLLTARRGVLVLNNHGNTVSARHVALRLNKDPAAMHNELSDRALRSLLAEAGFRVQEVHGFGLLPDVVHRTRLRSAARTLERRAARRQWLTPLTIDRVYVARA